jgi:hypothetical protein
MVAFRGLYPVFVATNDGMIFVPEPLNPIEVRLLDQE